MAATIENIFEEVMRLNEKLDNLPALIEVAAHQVQIVSLDELSETLGLIKAGEFRTGNLRVPGDSFSGVRMGYPGFYYPGTSTASSDLYNIVGVDADTLQFGLRASDGVAVAGGGAVTLDGFGITLAEGQATVNTITWSDSNIIADGAESVVASIYGYNAGLGSTSVVHGAVVIESAGHPNTDLETTDLTTDQIPFAASFFQSQVFSSDGRTGLNFVAVRNTADTTNLLLSGFQVRASQGYGTGTDAEDKQIDIFLLNPDPSVFELGMGSIVSTTNTPPLDFSWYGLSTGSPYVVFDADLESIYFGASDTTNFDLGWLNEKALTFASTATAGIEDPDNEMGKLWLDTDFEMRLTDTAGEDWFVTKSTSTGGGGARTLFHRVWSEDVNDLTDLGNGEIEAFGSDTTVNARSGELTFVANTVWQINGALDIISTSATSLGMGIYVLDTAGVGLLQQYLNYDPAVAIQQVFSGVTMLDSGFLVPAGVYNIALWSFSGVAGGRRYFGASTDIRRYLTVTELSRGHTVTT